MANFLKKSGTIPWTLYSIFLVCFRFSFVERINGEWRGFFSYLRINLVESVHYFKIKLPQKAPVFHNERLSTKGLVNCASRSFR